MYLTDLIRRAGRSLSSAKGRTILTALAIAVGAFALTLTLAASNGAQAYVSKIINENFDPAELIVANDPAILGRADTSKPQEYDANFTSVTSGGGATTQVKYISDDDIAKIKAVEGVEQVREDITVNLQYITRPGQKKYVGTVAAINPFQKPELLAGQISTPLGEKQLVLSESYLQSLGFDSAQSAIDKKVILSVLKPVSQQSLTGSGQPPTLAQESVQQEFNIAAIYKKPTTSQPGTELYMYTSQADARALNDIATAGTANFRKYQYVNVRIEGGKDPQTLKAAQERIKELGFTAQSVKDTQEFLNQIIAILQGIVLGFALIAIIASVFGIINTMYISVLSRTREIGLMKALGMRRRDIGRLFRFEAAWIGFLGGIIGASLAVALGLALNPWISSKLSLGNDRILIFNPIQIGVLILILIVVSIFAGWLPSRKAAKLDPIEALRTE
jgi:putative ABC transport system permease protein